MSKMYSIASQKNRITIRLAFVPRFFRAKAYPRNGSVKRIPDTILVVRTSKENWFMAQKEIDRPSRINSMEVHKLFSARLLMAMAKKGDSPMNASRGNEGISHAKLKRTVPPAKR